MKSIAIKRYGPLRRGRYQRRFDTPEQAKAAAERWFEEPDVKAVWAYGPDGAEILHKNLQQNEKGEQHEGHLPQG